MIYFLHCACPKCGHSRIKCGTTARFTDRLSQIRRLNFFGDRITMLATLAGSEAEEREILEALQPYRLEFEFFEDCATVREYINGLRNSEIVENKKDS